MKQLAVISLISVLLLTALSCDKASPVAPTGSTLTLSASPSRVTTANGTSTVTAVVLRENGTPVNPGTQVRFSTSIGAIDEMVETDSTGVARATLRGTGSIGTAKVRASAGAITPVEIDVVIGSLAGSVTLQATPSSVPEEGGQVELVALVRDDQGQPMVGASVNFSSPIGRLQSGGSFRTTDSSGRVTDRLTLSSSDIGTLTNDNFEVRVEVAGANGQLINDTFTVGIQRPPDADFSFVVSSTSRQVAFTDQTMPTPTRWEWDFGDGQTSTLQNPTHTYSNTNDRFVTLTVRNAVGSDSVTKQVTFPNSN